MIAEDAGLAAVVGPPNETCRLHDVRAYPASALRASVGNQPPKGTNEDVALLMYTSGSTGRAKGVPITHGGYVWALETLREHVPVFDSCLVSAPLFHMNGQAATFLYLAAGRTTVLLPRFSVRSALAAIETFQPQEVSGVPSMVAMLAQGMGETKSAFPWVKCLGLGSAPLTPPLIATCRELFPQATIDNGYGTTETGPVSFGVSTTDKPRPPGSLGYPMPGVEAHIEGDGDEGELLLRTPMTTAGYWQRPDLNKTAFVEGRYRTGDIVMRDGNGCYHFIDRRDDMIVCGGENVFPSDVERILENHPSVAQAAVVGIEHEIKGKVPVAFVVAKPGALLSERELRDHTLAHAPPYAHPRHIWIIDALPTGGTHKINRRLLTDQARRLLSVASESSSTP